MDLSPEIDPFEIQIEQMLKVLYDFDAEAGTELTVKEGDVLTILSKDAGDGWWNARLVFTFIRVLIYYLNTKNDVRLGCLRNPRFVFADESSVMTHKLCQPTQIVRFRCGYKAP